MSNLFSERGGGITSASLKGKKILFANFPADGHFNPLTGLAVHLKWLGCDVRWYTSVKYAPKLEKLKIPHLPFNKAVDIAELEKMFPERDAIKSQVAKLKFDIIHAFVLRGPEYYADLTEIHASFPFDIMIADGAFTGIPFVKDKMNIPVISIGVFPLTETSRDLPPMGLGMTPTYSFLGRIKQNILRKVSDVLVFGEPNKVMRKMLSAYGIDHYNTNVFDLIVKKSSLLLQSGTPGFEYFRSDLGKNIRYIGSLLPYQSKKQIEPWTDARLTTYQKIVVVTQGTVEKNVEKILVPTLDAFKDTDVLVIATTGGTATEELRERFPQQNLIIEDFIPFGDIMPYADVYITNGGYGGVMLGIENQLPLVVAGVHEGKNEINARIGYFELGINLKTEWPKPEQMKESVEEVINNRKYKENVMRLAKEFSTYNPNELCAQYVGEVLEKTGRVYVLEGEKVY
ncbi:MAG: glycosyltransferase [Chitinophagaceae bacterium]|nr:glycosyltransferase [Chitinophagaceae bacterium]